jgi:prepilin-type N-terminal cleavage/methylation domain-containing protein
VAPINRSKSNFMFTGLNRRRGFTLLEIIMAVAILATMALAIYRFVQSNMVAIRLSSEANAADARYDGLREVLAAQWQSLPSGKGALLGDAFKLSDRERDEIRWICSAGPGLMTRYAAGDFVVALRLQSEKKDSDRLDLGFLRKPKDDSLLTNANETWIPLIEDVGSMQIQYFSAITNVWQQGWNNGQALPQLVKLVVQRRDAAVPWEVIIPVRRTPWQQ